MATKKTPPKPQHTHTCEACGSTNVRLSGHDRSNPFTGEINPIPHMACDDCEYDNSEPLEDGLEPYE